MKQNYFCSGCEKQIPIILGANQLHICDCGTLNNIVLTKPTRTTNDNIYVTNKTTTL